MALKIDYKGRYDLFNQKLVLNLRFISCKNVMLRKII